MTDNARLVLYFTTGCNPLCNENVLLRRALARRESKSVCLYLTVEDHIQQMYTAVINTACQKRPQSGRLAHVTRRHSLRVKVQSGRLISVYYVTRLYGHRVMLTAYTLSSLWWTKRLMLYSFT